MKLIWTYEDELGIKGHQIYVSNVWHIIKIKTNPLNFN